MLHVFQNWDEGTSFRTKMNIGLYFSAEREIGLFWNSSSYYVIIIFSSPIAKTWESKAKNHMFSQPTARRFGSSLSAFVYLYQLS